MKRTRENDVVSLKPTKKMRLESIDVCEDEGTENVTGIHTLPQEMLTLVFSFLTPAEIHNNVAQVCPEWQELLLDPSIYRVFEFKTLNEDLQSKLKYLRRAPWLVSLTLENQVDTTTLLETVCSCNRRLHNLTLRSCRGSPNRENVTASTLKKLLRKCPQLRELKFKNIKGLTRVFYKQIGWRLPHLRKVHFINTQYFGSEALLSLAYNCPRLEELRACHKFQSIELGITNDDEIRMFCSKVGGTLKRLELNGLQWTECAFEALAQCKNLEQLAVRFASRLSDNVLLKLGSLLNLTRLDLMFVTVSESTWTRAFSTTSLRRLKKLSLIICSITNEVAAAIGTHLKDIEKICLSGILGLDGTGVEAIIKGCSSLRHLELLLMEQNLQESLLLVPKHLPRLERLICTETMTETTYEIQRQMPRLIIEPGNPRWNDFFVTILHVDHIEVM